MRKLTSQQIDVVCQSYLAGDSSPVLAGRYNVSDVAIRGLLKRRGIARRPQTICQQKYNLRRDAFAQIADETTAAGWILCC